MWEILRSPDHSKRVGRWDHAKSEDQFGKTGSKTCCTTPVYLSESFVLLSICTGRKACHLAKHSAKVGWILKSDSVGHRTYAVARVAQPVCGLQDTVSV